MVRRCPDAAGAPAGAAVGTVPSFSLREGTASPSLAATTSLPFSVSNLVRPNTQLSSILTNELRSAVRGGAKSALDATADSFYASQGRVSGIPDRNAALIPALSTAGISVLQMETFHLLELARIQGAKISAAAAHIIVFDRIAATAITAKDLAAREAAAGRAALAALAAFPIGPEADIGSSGGAGAMPTS